jgi:hypothetical protein
MTPDLDEILDAAPKTAQRRCQAKIHDLPDEAQELLRRYRERHIEGIPNPTVPAVIRLIEQRGGKISVSAVTRYRSEGCSCES